MSTLLVVPAARVPQLRSGLLGEWGHAAHSLYALTPETGSDATSRAYRDALDRFNACRALIDLLGWRRERREVAARIDLSANALYPAIVLAALSGQRTALAPQLGELRPPTNGHVRQIGHSRVIGLGDLIASTEGNAETLQPRPPRPLR